MSEQRHRTVWETVGMLAGITAFLAGVVMLVLVFGWAFSLFRGARQELSAAAGPVQTVLGEMGLKVALLFVMGYLASLIASKGLQLYGVCRGVSPR